MAKFCKKCGAQLADEAIFCPKCGSVQSPSAPQPQGQVPPQPQPRPQPQAQYQQPQAQYQQPYAAQPYPAGQPVPAVRKEPAVSFGELGFKKTDFKFNPIKELKSGDLSRYSVFALFLSITALFFSLLNVISTGLAAYWDEIPSGVTLHFAEFYSEKFVATTFRVIFMILFILSIVWVVFRMFLKKSGVLDLLIMAGTATLYFITVLVSVISVCSRSVLTVSFAGILFFLFIFSAIAACVLPLIFKLINKK